MTEDAFDLFSGGIIKVPSKVDEERREADAIQRAAAIRMGDVPPDRVDYVIMRKYLEEVRERVIELMMYPHDFAIDFGGLEQLLIPPRVKYRPEPKTLRERERAHWTSLNARGRKWMK